MYFGRALLLIRSIANISKNRPNLIDNYIPLIVRDTISVVEENMTIKKTLHLPLACSIVVLKASTYRLKQCV